MPSHTLAVSPSHSIWSSGQNVGPVVVVVSVGSGSVVVPVGSTLSVVLVLVVLSDSLPLPPSVGASVLVGAEVPVSSVVAGRVVGRGEVVVPESRGLPSSLQAARVRATHGEQGAIGQSHVPSGRTTAAPRCGSAR
jgi:hypothetical protein